MDKSWIPIGLCLALAGLTAFSSVYMRIKAPKPEDGRLAKRVAGRGLQILSQQVIFASLMVIVWFTGGFSASEFGVSLVIPPLIAFGVGFLVYFVVLGLVEVLSGLLGIREKLHDCAFETMRFVWPRERMQKMLAIVAVCILNPFTEEVLYRGVLVYYLGNQTGFLVFAIVLGLTLSLLAHAYQGLWLAPFHLLFHGTAILLVFSPLGLFGCFGMHFAGDLIPVVMMRKSMLAWRERRRGERG